MRNALRNLGYICQDVWGWVIDRPYFIARWWEHRHDCKHPHARVVSARSYPAVWPNEGAEKIEHKYQCPDCGKEYRTWD